MMSLTVVFVVGCGSGDVGVASPPASPGPTAPTGSQVGLGGPTEESAARFAVDVVGRLEQEAFWATDGGFLDPIVVPDAREVVVGELKGRVDEARWAIATFPGPTRRTWFVAAPLTVEVAGFDPAAGRAVVRVWVVSVFSREDLGMPQSSFTVEEADLVWDSAERVWRVEALRVSPGPAVSLASTEVPVLPAELDTALAGHRLIGVGGSWVG